MPLRALAASSELQGLFQFTLEQELLRSYGIEGDLRFPTAATIELVRIDETLADGTFSGDFETQEIHLGHTTGRITLEVPGGLTDALDRGLAGATLRVLISTFPGLPLDPRQ